MISARKKTRGFCYILFYFAFLTKVYCFFSNKWRGVKFLYFLTIPYYHIINNLLKRWLRNIREFPQKPKHLSMIRIKLPCNFLRLHDRKNVFLEISQFLRKHLSICNIPKSSILLCSAKNFFTRYKLFSVCQCRHGREGIPSTNGRWYCARTHTHWQAKFHNNLFDSAVCNFQSMKSRVELNNFLLKFFCYIN